MPDEITRAGLVERLRYLAADYEAALATTPSAPLDKFLDADDINTALAAAAEIERLTALVSNGAFLTDTPGAMTVNCLRGTARCTERERLTAEIERLRSALREMVRLAAAWVPGDDDFDSGVGAGLDPAAEMARAALEGTP